MTVSLKELGSKLSYLDINDMIKLFASPETEEPSRLYDGQIWLKLTANGPVLVRYNQGLNEWETVGGVTTQNLLTLIKAQDGPGSGLDADYLDGKNADEFIPRTSTGACIDISTLDLNLITKSGMFRGQNVINAPDSSWFYFLVFKHNETFILQMAFTLFLTNGFWVRVNINDNWAGGWKKIWYQENDGVNSGLDADKLDGQQGNFYQDASNLTAGTIALDRIPALLTGKDADTLDGQHGGFYQNAGNLNSGAVPRARLSELGDVANPYICSGKINVTEEYQFIYYGVSYSSAPIIVASSDKALIPRVITSSTTSWQVQLVRTNFPTNDFWPGIVYWIAFGNKLN